MQNITTVHQASHTLQNSNTLSGETGQARILVKDGLSLAVFHIKQRTISLWSFQNTSKPEGQVLHLLHCTIATASAAVFFHSCSLHDLPPSPYPLFGPSSDSATNTYGTVSYFLYHTNWFILCMETTLPGGCSSPVSFASDLVMSSNFSISSISVLLAARLRGVSQNGVDITPIPPPHRSISFPLLLRARDLVRRTITSWPQFHATPLAHGILAWLQLIGNKGNSSATKGLYFREHGFWTSYVLLSNSGWHCCSRSCWIPLGQLMVWKLSLVFHC